MFKPETLVQPQPIKRQRSPSPTPVNQPQLFQGPQHQNFQSNQNSCLSPLSNTSTVFQQTHMFSPNKKSRITSQPNPSANSIATINPYVPILMGQSQPRIPTSYSTPQQSAFTAYPNQFFNALQQNQQQKAPFLVSNNQIHASPQAISFPMPPRLVHQTG